VAQPYPVPVKVSCYYEDEDCGIFWSNDRQVPVRQMVRALGLAEAEEQLISVREFYRKAGVLDY
jgi:hypothetical protein